MKILLSIYLLLLSACNEAGTESRVVADSKTVSKLHLTPPKKKLIQVKGTAVNFDITTFIAISCKGYDAQFSDAKPFVIADTAKLLTIANRLGELKPDPHQYGLDVRAKAILLYNDHSTDTLCISMFNSYYKGHLMLPDQELYRLLGVDTK